MNDTDRDKHASGDGGLHQHHQQQKVSTDSEEVRQKYSEISPNKRYIRFEELISQTGNIKFSFKAFDTRNGTEVVWQKINMSDLSESDQERISRSANYLKEVQHKHIMEYLAIWLIEEPRTLNLITTYLDSLKQFIGKVKTLRWRIVKKWCRHILRGLHYLHTSDPCIIHRNLTWTSVFVNPGLGELYIGGMWLSAILTDSADPISVSDALSEHYEGSPAYIAPEITEKLPLTTKTDIYSFGMCVLVMIFREEPYGECGGDRARIARCTRRGVLPVSLSRVEYPPAVEFIRACLHMNPADRLSAEELLDHHFLQETDDDDKEVTIGPPIELTAEQLAEYDAEDPISTVPLSTVNEARQLSESELSSRGADTGADLAHSSSGHSIVQGEKAAHQLLSRTHTASDTLHTVPAEIYTNISPAAPGHIPVTQLPLDTVESTPVTGPPLALSIDTETEVGEPVLNRLDKELAALSKGEDVHRDKGIHDGRRDKDEDVEPQPSPHTRSQSVPSLPSSVPAAIATPPPSGATQPLPSSSHAHTHQRSLSNPVLPPSFSAMSPSGTPTTIRAVPNATSTNTTEGTRSVEEAPVVAVQLRIAEGHTSDGIIKDVEFLFNTEKDNFEVVATEMKEELNLTIPTEQLSTLIQLQVNSVAQLDSSREDDLEGGGEETGSGNSSTQYDETLLLAAAGYGITVTDASESGDDCRNKMNTAPSASGVDTSATNIMDGSGQELEQIRAVTPASFSSHPTPASVSSSGAADEQLLKTPSPGLPPVHPNSMARTTESPVHLHPHDTTPTPAGASAAGSLATLRPGRDESADSINSTTSAGSQTVTADSNPISPASMLEGDRSRVSPESSHVSATGSPLDRSEHNTITQSTSNNSLSSLDTGGHRGGACDMLEPIPEVPPPGEDASEAEVQDYAEYLKETEKIAKECRAAKRVFEQRIHKHKVIQETCEEDLQKVKAGYTQQCSQLDKSEAKALKKKDELMVQAKREFEEKVEALREARREKRRMRKQQLLLARQLQTQEHHGEGSMTSMLREGTIPFHPPQTQNIPAHHSQGQSYDAWTMQQAIQQQPSQVSASSGTVPPHHQQCSPPRSTI
mmetsp:Transcript_149/g.263  ORF Transcript_149/g.263 Transcript_149/m.263 type:complete len:1094 (+) Transcript_149:111-3392(+)|eukprot:CAMPEP_0185033842 /NCGR_PEP_ID=MMETSP1103-20130426/23201_1 /TAXON_ID=36769 /ORGANISM="Paraphysomonas bandaiensis, Strain Caron Lab Isolate" /LENGTH=1093 /DNA_ID=CAMNT_0027570261 /DNA_START=46 /DNA_END=3327 /DNA_ORIENTATION=+